MDTIMDHARKKLRLSRKVECNPDYSKEEDDILYKYYEQYGPTYCSSLLSGRTESSIRSHANKKLGLKTPDKFTEESGFDLKAFEEYYKKHSIKATAEKFGITKLQTINIAHRKSFKRSKQTIKTGKPFKPVVCVELNKIFYSVEEIMDEFNIPFRSAQEGS